MFIVNCDAVTRTRKVFPAHRAGRAATHNRNITHRTASMKRAEPGTGPGAGQKVTSGRRKSRGHEPCRKYSRKDGGSRGDRFGGCGSVSVHAVSRPYGT